MEFELLHRHFIDIPSTLIDTYAIPWNKAHAKRGIKKKMIPFYTPKKEVY